MNKSFVRTRQSDRNIVPVCRSRTGAASVLSVFLCVTAMTACVGPVKPVLTTEPKVISPASAESAQTTKPAEQVLVESVGKPAAPLPLPPPAPDAARVAPTGVESEAPVLEAKPVQVTAQRESYSVTHAQTATKTDTPLMDTPMSVKVVPQQVMLDQQVVRIDQALRNVSGVISGAEGDQQFNVRGFDQFNFYRDGYPFQSQWFHGEDLTNIDRVEVLKGPGSILYGRSEPGGIINFVTKQPLDTPYYSLRQQFGFYGWYRTNADLTGPLTADGRLSYRFNLGYQTNQNFQEFGGNERLIIAPQIRWRITERTTTTLKYEYSDVSLTGRGNIPLLGNRPAPIARELNLGERWNLQNDKYHLVSLLTEHAFNDAWRIRHRFNFSNHQLTLSGQSVFGTVTGTGDVARSFFAQNTDGRDHTRNFFNALEVLGHVSTGPVKHTLLFGGDYLHTDIRATMAGFTPGTDDVINIFNPIHKAGPPVIQPGDVTKFDWSLPWFGLYAQDQIELPYHIHILAGFRYDNAKTSTASENLGVQTPTSKDTNDRISPRGGVLWRPIPELALYGSYTENFGASNTFQTGSAIPLPPQTAQQWEVGAKTELWGGRFAGSLAYFNLKKQNLPVFFPGEIRAIGEGESRGLELDITGEILPGWSVIGAYAYVPFAKTTQDDPALGNMGKRLNNAPVNSGSLWSVYQFQEERLQGLRVGAGMQGVGERQIGFGETAQAHGYVIANLMASYQWRMGGVRYTAQLNVDNLLDKSYVGHIFSYGPTYYGTPRFFMGSIRAEF